MVLIHGILNSDLSVKHGNNGSFTYKSPCTRWQMVHISSLHNVPRLPNLIHNTDEGINASSRNALTTLRRCTRARGGMDALQAISLSIVII